MHATNEVNRGLSDPADALQRIDEVLRLSRSAVWEVDLDGTFTYVSASFEDLLGYRPEELVGRRTIHDFYAPDVPEDLRPRLSPEWIAKGEEFREMAIPLVAKSGKIVWISSSGTPVRDADGRITGSRGVDTDITALKRAEESVRASERALWRQMQEAPLPMAFTALSDAGELHVNRAFVRVFGYEPEEIPTLEAWFARSYPDPADREQVQRDTHEWMAQAARGEMLPPREYRLTCRDGRVLDVEIAAAVVAGRFVGTFTDVTSRRRELESRKAREEELFGILDNLPFPVTVSLIGADGSWRNPENKLVFLNRRHVEVFGYTTEDCPNVGEFWLRAYPEASGRGKALAHWDRELARVARQGGRAAPRESRLRTKSGEVRDIETSATITGDKMVTCFRDLTERNRTRQRLEESRERLRAVVENIPVPVAYTLAGGTAINLNKAFTETYGWTEEDVPTLDDWFAKAYPDPVCRGEVLAAWGEDLQRARRGDGNIDARLYRVMAKDGTVRDVEISAVIFEGELFGSVLDVTERNLAERLLREQREQLARAGRVSALGQLAAALAHELDQPLGAILNNAETARMLLAGKRPDLAELGEIVRDILEDDRRAGAVLDRIRAMVQRQAFQTAAVDLPSLCRELAALVQSAAANQGIKLEFSCEPGLPPVEGDRVLLQQALLNIVLNSVDALGGRSDGRIEVCAGPVNENNLKISVGDNAGGVPSAEVEHLLEPFHTTKEGGLGMGLPIVNSIVEQHGGRLLIENQPGRGLTVHLVLPRWRGPSA